MKRYDFMMIDGGMSIAFSRRMTLQAQTNDQLAQSLLPLVYQVAAQIARRIPSHIMMDDLVGAGMLGLAGALTRFDPEQSMTFRGYAEFRIRGEILDELRRRDTMSRDNRIERKRIQQTAVKLSAELGREALDEEMAEHLGLSLDDYWTRQRRLDEARHVSADYVEIADQGEDPFQVVDGQEMRDQLAHAIERLPRRQRTVLWLYYYEDLPLREIADLLAVSSSRICQIRAEACERLRKTLEEAI
jgi:RNA polymerase sigma factor for flagellar operon FliA